MGRLFAYEQVKAGEVPDSSEFIAAKKHFIESAQAYIDDGSLDGAFIYGSVAVDLANKRSDFDVFLSTTSLPLGLSAAKHLVEDVRKGTKGKIPISPTVKSLRALSLGHHEMDRFFGEHLASGHRYVLGQDPAQQIVFPAHSAQDIMAGYLAGKKERLSNTYTSVEPLDLSRGGLQRMLELPVAIGRKTLQALAETNHIEKAVQKTADKKQVLAAMREVLQPEDLVGGFDAIIYLNKKYNRTLEGALTGFETKKSYETVINELHKALPDAITWVGQLEENLLPKLGSPKE